MQRQEKLEENDFKYLRELDNIRQGKIPLPNQQVEPEEPEEEMNIDPLDNDIVNQHTGELKDEDPTLSEDEARKQAKENAFLSLSVLASLLTPPKTTKPQPTLSELEQMTPEQLKEYNIGNLQPLDLSALKDMDEDEDFGDIDEEEEDIPVKEDDVLTAAIFRNYAINRGVQKIKKNDDIIPIAEKARKQNIDLTKTPEQLQEEDKLDEEAERVFAIRAAAKEAVDATEAKSGVLTEEQINRIIELTDDSVKWYLKKNQFGRTDTLSALKKIEEDPEFAKRIKDEYIIDKKGKETKKEFDQLVNDAFEWYMDKQGIKNSRAKKSIRLKAEKDLGFAERVIMDYIKRDEKIQAELQEVVVTEPHSEPTPEELKKVPKRMVLESTFKNYDDEKMKKLFSDNQIPIKGKKLNFNDRGHILDIAKKNGLIKGSGVAGSGFRQPSTVARELHGEGFFSDLKDKIGMWLFKNVHPVGRLSSYVQGKGFSNNLRIHKGFPNNRIRPLSSYPPHIIAGALHIVKNMRRNRPNQNEYNREQAHRLLQQTLHGE
jgi:hypothetical protein